MEYNMPIINRISKPECPEDFELVKLCESISKLLADREEEIVVSALCSILLAVFVNSRKINCLTVEEIFNRILRDYIELAGNR